MTLGDRVQSLREDRGWSQRELARRAMLHHGFVSELEQGKRRDALGQTIKKLAITLKTSADYLIGMYDN